MVSLRKRTHSGHANRVEGYRGPELPPFWRIESNRIVDWVVFQTAVFKTIFNHRKKVLFISHLCVEWSACLLVSRCDHRPNMKLTSARIQI